MDLSAFQKEANRLSKENKAFLSRLNRVNHRNLDEVFHALHEEVFEELDCLSCANCCKTTSPIFYESDIDRLAKFLKVRPAELIVKYLSIDGDGDYVVKSSPCPFLGEDNYCSVYESRPKACREYPHTNRKKMYQLTSLTYKNTLVCPAVLEIVERLKQIPL